MQGYSLADQMQTLRKHATDHGYEIVAEVEDAGHSGAYLERPGMDRVRDLVAAGGVDVVLAQDADRITREPGDRSVLDLEAERRGCRWVALHDWGDDSHEGQLPLLRLLSVPAGRVRAREVDASGQDGA